MTDNPLGQLWGISVGPGDPDLITLKALKLLQTCAVVAFPAGRNDNPGLAQRIITPWLHPHQVQLALYFPYVQDRHDLEAAWQVAAEQVMPYLMAHQDVVFATEGDASLYSTFTYLAQTIQQQYPQVTITTIPGVCSPLAAAALLREPLAIYDQKLMILPALHTLSEFQAALEQADVLVLLKVASVYTAVWDILQQRQLLHRSRVVVQATQDTQRIYADLTLYPTLQLPYFSLLIVHCQPPIR